MDKLKVSKNDRLISVGDLVFKGPSTSRTLDLAMSLPNLEVVVGNHESFLIEGWKKGAIIPQKPYHAPALKEMQKKMAQYRAYIESWPYSIVEKEFCVVHAGLHPDRGVTEQRIEDVTTLRTLEDGRAWFDAYSGSRLVVFGHWARLGLIERNNVIGLDTGCVYGGRLSAVVLPERKVVSVPARRAYIPKG